ncbi:Ldh family oxidoreductase [Frigidibacter albus]|uniref:Ldh family oxidoreductase n=1 Tax=Frigidibacter albus TaxID=1465486 RepID=A0A6L8VKI2_9RHOB|nr:Ldh family oxidoreductase [Frigidibacter albus]MZQ90858.1 Ldh family oxidoreductase [Frigidibacter albus]NBE32524.1 Ldh family oxidoreductase [Frigidibacter albus]GGH61521.1 dehydrogenase [Frigidibacter albus]
MRVTEPVLRRLAVDLLEAHGAPPEAAWLQADLLIEAELRGLPSHGLQRLPRLLARIGNGLADPVATGEQHWRRAAFLQVDGQRALGPVALMAAMEALLPATRAAGLALAAIRNANHIGMLAYYAEAAASRGVIGIVLSTSEALVHPFGGTEAMLGTNPVAIAIPTGDAPFVLDLASSVVSMGKIHHHALKGEALAPGWAVDAAGNPTTDAEAAKTGAISPFGGAKGYGLGLAFELLVAMLAGSELAPEVRGTLDASHPASKGDLLILIDPGADGGVAARLCAYLDALRHSRPADPASPVAVPGDGMRVRRAAALRDGIDIPDSLLNDLQTLRAA